MDAGQITIMPTVGGSLQPSAAVLATDTSGTQGVLTSLFGELLGENVLGLQGFGNPGQNTAQ